MSKDHKVTSRYGTKYKRFMCDRCANAHLSVFTAQGTEIEVTIDKEQNKLRLSMLPKGFPGDVGGEVTTADGAPLPIIGGFHAALQQATKAAEEAAWGDGPNVTVVALGPNDDITEIFKALNAPSKGRLH